MTHEKDKKGSSCPYSSRNGSSIRSYAIPDCAVNTQIIAAALGNKAGSIGAASLFFK